MYSFNWNRSIIHFFNMKILTNAAKKVWTLKWVSVYLNVCSYLRKCTNEFRNLLLMNIVALNLDPAVTTATCMYDHICGEVLWIRTDHLESNINLYNSYLEICIIHGDLHFYCIRGLQWLCLGRHIVYKFYCMLGNYNINVNIHILCILVKCDLKWDKMKKTYCEKRIILSIPSFLNVGKVSSLYYRHFCLLASYCVNI